MSEIEPDKILSKVSLLFQMGISSYTITDEIEEYLKEVQPGSVNLTLQFFQKFKMNVRQGERRQHLKNVCDKIRTIVPGILIGIDHEGGLIQNLPPPDWTLIPANRQVGLSEEDMAFKIGKLMGRELRVSGIDWNFAPVIDVSTQEEYHYRYFGRTLSDDVERVSLMGCKLIEGQQEAGIIATAKHYPNMGSCTGDTHFSQPVVKSSVDQFEKSDLTPFGEVIKSANVNSIMTNHAIYENVDPKNVATFSKKIMIDYLRDDLGMAGCQMFKKKMQWSETTYAKMALEAGNDVIMYCFRIKEAREAFNGIKELIKNEEIDLKRLSESISRFEKLRKAHFERKKKLEEEDEENVLQKFVACEENVKFAKSFPKLRDPVLEGPKKKKLVKKKNTVGSDYRDKKDGKSNNNGGDKCIIM